MSNNDGVVQGRLFPEYEVAVKASIKKTAPKRKASVKELQNDVLRLSKEISEKQKEIERLQTECKKLSSRAEAFDDLIRSNSLFTIGVIAKNFGHTANWLNKYLHEKKVQFKRGKAWELYAKYANRDYTRVCWYNYGKDSQGQPLQRPHTYWTGKGLAFIRELLKADGLV
ncbi:MAG: phage antirepressor KilAC domain-containing protein [Alphaproteobacteria bacterium]|nr:phage antirepressor KilAC domain-containing protein [Alphaproteobacteria bacterium]